MVAVAAALALAVYGTWPIAAHPASRVYGGGLGVPATGPHPDVYLTVWILAWTAHALATAPWSLLEANIFHPTPHALALSENMLGALPLYLPLAALSRDPIFAHQATLVLTFACAFLAALVLVRDWTGSWWAAVVGGTLFAFSCCWLHRS